MRTMRWWQFGLLGGLTLSIATAIKVVRSGGGAEPGDPPGGVAGFAAALFGMGFVCGVMVWAGRGLYDRLGMLGDALVGAVVMPVFFLGCMLVFEPELLGEKFGIGGGPMLVGGAVLGAIGAAWVGRDIRKEAEPPKRRPRRPVRHGAEGKLPPGSE